MKNKFMKMAVAGLVLGASSFANAGLIFNNGSAISDSSRCAETSGACSGTWTIFDDFTVTNDSHITSVSWTAILYGGISDYNFSNIWFYDNDPVFDAGKLLFSHSAAGIVVANSLRANAFDITLSGFSKLPTSGTYWLGIQHNTDTNYGTVATTGRTINATQWQ